MFTGLVPSGSTGAQLVVDAGILLSTVLNVQALFQFTVLCTWIKEVVKISIASAILRGTVTTSTKARCAWDSGLVIVPVMVSFMEEVPTPTRDLNQCPGSLLKKFPSLKTRFRYQTV